MPLSVVNNLNKQCDRRFGRHGMPPPASNPDICPFDLETGVQVASKVRNLPSKFGHARPLGSRIIRYVLDRRTDGRTDGRTKATLNAPFPTVGGTIICSTTSSVVDVSFLFSLFLNLFSCCVSGINSSLMQCNVFFLSYMFCFVLMTSLNHVSITL